MLHIENEIKTMLIFAQLTKGVFIGERSDYLMQVRCSKLPTAPIAMAFRPSLIAVVPLVVPLGKGLMNEIT